MTDLVGDCDGEWCIGIASGMDDTAFNASSPCMYVFSPVEDGCAKVPRVSVRSKSYDGGSCDDDAELGLLTAPSSVRVLGSDTSFRGVAIADLGVEGEREADTALLSLLLISMFMLSSDMVEIALYYYYDSNPNVIARKEKTKITLI